MSTETSVPCPCCGKAILDSEARLSIALPRVDDQPHAAIRDCHTSCLDRWSARMRETGERRGFTAFMTILTRLEISKARQA